MSEASPTREVHIRDCPLDVALAWVGAQMTDVRISNLPAGSMVFCDGSLGGEPARVIVTPGMDDGFLSLCLDSPPFPWAPHVDMARAVFADLKREVRCDPGDLGKAPLSASEWWSVSEAGDGLIVWPGPSGED